MSSFFYSVLKIFSSSDIGMVHSGVCTGIDLENRYRLDSVLHIDKCTLQYCTGFLLATYETVYSAYLQCTLVWCTQHIYSVLFYGIRFFIGL